MILRFCSGSSTPSSSSRKRSCACTCTSGTPEVLAERLDDLLRLVLAQQAVVDEDARELVADRLVHEQRGDGGVDAAGERAEHALARRPARGCARPAPRSPRPASTRAARRRSRRGSSSARPCRAACARPRDGTARRRARARATRTRRSASTREPATTRAPSGGATTESRCDIHTVCSAGVSFSSADSSTCSSVLPNSETPVRSTRPPRSSAISCMP